MKYLSDECIEKLFADVNITEEEIKEVLRLLGAESKQEFALQIIKSRPENVSLDSFISMMNSCLKELLPRF